MTMRDTDNGSCLGAGDRGKPLDDVIAMLRQPLGENDGFATMYGRLSLGLAALLEQSANQSSLRSA